MKAIIPFTIAGLIALGGLVEAEHEKQSVDVKQHREMMPVHAKIIELQKRQNADLNRLVLQMDSATGESRIDATISVVKKLIVQQREMNAEIASRLDR